MDRAFRDPLGLPRRERLELGRDRAPSSAPSSVASSLRRSPGSTTVTGPIPRATSAAIDRAPIGPAPDDHDAVARRGAGPGDPVQRDRQRLGQRRLARRSGPEAGERGLPPGPARSGRTRRRGRRRSNPAGSRTATACLRGSAGNVRTSAWCRPRRSRRARQPVDPLTERGDGTGELVAGHQAGLVAPPLEQHVDVRTADPAVIDLDQDLVRARARAPASPRPRPRPAGGRPPPASSRAARPCPTSPTVPKSVVRARPRV